MVRIVHSVRMNGMVAQKVFAGQTVYADREDYDHQKFQVDQKVLDVHRTHIGPVSRIGCKVPLVHKEWVLQVARFVFYCRIPWSLKH